MPLILLRFKHLSHAEQPYLRIVAVWGGLRLMWRCHLPSGAAGGGALLGRQGRSRIQARQLGQGSGVRGVQRQHDSGARDLRPCALWHVQCDGGVEIRALADSVADRPRGSDAPGRRCQQRALR